MAICCLSTVLWSLACLAVPTPIGEGAGGPSGHPNTAFKGCVAECGAECVRCTTRGQERRGRVKTPEVFSRAGGLWHAPVPRALQGLSYAEEAVISRVQPIVAVQVLRMLLMVWWHRRFSWFS